MAKFQIIEVFRLPARAQFVIAGKVTTGEVRVGMHALVLFDSQLYWRIPIVAVEFIDRIANRESLIGLVCNETTTEDAHLCHGLWWELISKLQTRRWGCDFTYVAPA